MSDASSPDAPSPDASPLSTGLSIRGISKQYGPVTVLRGVDLDVRPGEVVALLGENGAGKSTVSSIIAGLVQPSAGTMTWNGRPYAPTSPADALSQGIGLIHQEMRLLPELSIAENVFVGHLPTRRGRVDRAGMARRATEQLRRLGLDASADTLVRDLRVAAQQQVEIAKALTLDARLLIFDEPTAALGGEETDQLFAQIARFKQAGLGFVYISHRLDEIARIADRVLVLRDGQLVGAFESARVPVKTLVETMVGRPLDRMFPPIEPARGREVLRVEGLTSPTGAFTDVSFSVKAGEVFGIAGIVGAGRTELVRAIAGADPIESGHIAVEGQRLVPRQPSDSLKAGIVLVPEDRKAQGLVLEHSIGDNIALGNYGRVAPRGFVLPGAVSRFAQDGIRRFGIKGRAGQPCKHLSGGNQQKVVLAKSLARQPRIVILDEPTRGIDVGARAQIYDVITALAREGLAVIVVSSDLDEVLGLSHRVMERERGFDPGGDRRGGGAFPRDDDRRRRGDRHVVLELVPAPDGRRDHPDQAGEGQAGGADHGRDRQPRGPVARPASRHPHGVAHGREGAVPAGARRRGLDREPGGAAAGSVRGRDRGLLLLPDARLRRHRVDDALADAGEFRQRLHPAGARRARGAGRRRRYGPAVLRRERRPGDHPAQRPGDQHPARSDQGLEARRRGGGTRKIPAIAAALKGSYLDVLITDHATAEHLAGDVAGSR